MGLNFGAIAQGISNVLEEDKKLKAAEKRLERQFENDVEKISMRTALDRETEELKRRREEREQTVPDTEAISEGSLAEGKYNHSEYFQFISQLRY